MSPLSNLGNYFEQILLSRMFFIVTAPPANETTDCLPRREENSRR